MQDDPASDGDLAFQLSSQPSSSHSQLTVDLPVNILQVRHLQPLVPLIHFVIQGGYISQQIKH